VIHAGDYIFVKAEQKELDRDQKPNLEPEDLDPIRFPWIAKVRKVKTQEHKLDIFWLYHPHTLPQATKSYRGPYELLLSNHHDVIDLDSVCNLAAVEENRDDCRTRHNWCWNQRYDYYKKKLQKQGQSRKKRRVI
jgi:hypothetical protein